MAKGIPPSSRPSQLVETWWEQFLQLVDRKNVRYQVKSRVWRKRTPIFSNILPDSFDFLVTLVFEPDLSIREAYVTPSVVVRQLARPRKSSWRLSLGRNIKEHPDVVDATAAFRTMVTALGAKKEARA